LSTGIEWFDAYKVGTGCKCRFFWQATVSYGIHYFGGLYYMYANAP